jgi:NADH-quinone oxidoreductase subunit C
VTPDELAGRVRVRYPDTIVARDEVTVIVERDQLREALAWLAAEPGLELGMLSSVTATHWPDRDPSFWVAYELRSIPNHIRCRVKVGLREGDAQLPSVTDRFPTADWHEREVFDFFGVTFEGHPDLTRILMPDDWVGFPLRKDEELGGVNTWFEGGAFHPPIDKRTGP